MVETADAMTAPGAREAAPLPKRNGTKRILSRQTGVVLGKSEPPTL